jgi:hypothetical protein
VTLDHAPGGPADARPASREILTLAAIITLALLVRMTLFIGYQGFDDRTYISYAWYYAHGGDFVAARIADHWVGRAGAWLPMAWAISIFGGAEWVLCLYSLVTSLAGFVVLFLLGRLLLGERAALYAAALLVLLPLDILYATRAFADEALGFWNLSAFTTFLFAIHRDRASLWCLSGLLTGVAYGTKETSVLIAVPMALALLHYRIFPVRGMLWTAAGFAAFLLGELTFWASQTGDPFYRFRGLVSVRGEFVLSPKTRESLWDWIPGPLPVEVVRSDNSLVEAALMFLTNEEWGLLFYFVLPVGISAIFGRHSGRKVLAIFVTSTAALLLFFPTFFPKFTLQRDPRYYTMVSAPALLLFAAWALSLRRRFRMFAFGSLALSWIPCLYVGSISSNIDVERELAAYLKRERQETVWMGNLDASNTVILSGFDPGLKIGIIAPPAAQVSGDMVKAKSPSNRAMLPDAPTVRSPEGLRGQLVAVSDDSAPRHGWTLVRSFTAKDGDVAIRVRRLLSALGVPEPMVAKVAPSHGKTIRLFRTP